MKPIHDPHIGHRLAERFQAYLLNHVHGLLSSLGRLSRTPFTSAMTLLVLAIAISLAAAFYIVVANLQQMTGNLQASNQMSLFLKDNVSEAAAGKLAEQFRQHGGIESANVITRQQAMAEFKAHSGFGDALKALDSNPLPNLIQVQPKHALDDKAAVEALLTELRQIPQVEFVQIDMQWVSRLQAVMAIASRSVAIVGVLLGLAVIFITGNTIRLELQDRRNEVYIAKLVGATNGFIQRPFLYAGFWLGLIAGVIAWIIVTLMLVIVESPVEKLSSLYDGSFELMYISFSEFMLLLMMTSTLAVLGSWAVVHYQLRQIKPQ
ncbi:MAG: permease-like cell division protein FtsX [Methylomonas sp.]|nr:permease-like cell division protein FtsX [Methylomonas sp.]PPD20085.1 MAG: hypothetical protein CTY23_10040 [Methylomonas sp.]PPD26006.1 MAG: hypothetical protein CTY22_06580 [Methylomonas sp.]PPD37735.1 MAG: hypothetical protein CTY21_06575 [Methylomonas sp.]PPD39617.1 MAG: hypothetical protein CTY17_07870 [Methylomonas sp.]